MREIKLQDLKSKTPAELVSFAEENGVENASTMIPRNVRISEAPSYGKPVLVYDLKCVGSEAYLRLATEVIQRERELRVTH